MMAAIFKLRLLNKKVQIYSILSAVRFFLEGM
jgi:hypothetical protein